MPPGNVCTSGLHNPIWPRNNESVFHSLSPGFFQKQYTENGGTNPGGTFPPTIFAILVIAWDAQTRTHVHPRPPHPPPRNSTIGPSKQGRTVRHMGHLLLWSVERMKHPRQKVCPHGVVTGSYSSFRQRIHSMSSTIVSARRARFGGLATDAAAAADADAAAAAAADAAGTSAIAPRAAARPSAAFRLAGSAARPARKEASASA